MPNEREAPERIWLLDYGTDECTWCVDPSPSGENHAPVEYVRADAAISVMQSHTARSHWKPLGRGTGKRPKGVRDDDVVRRNLSCGVGWLKMRATECVWFYDLEYELLVHTPSAESDGLREALQRIADSAERYTTGEGHQECRQIALAALAATTEGEADNV